MHDLVPEPFQYANKGMELYMSESLKLYMPIQACFWNMLTSDIEYGLT